MVLDELHRPQLRCAGHGDSPGMGEKTIERIEAGTQHAFYVIHGVEQLRVGLNLPPRQHLDRTRHADPRLVVAVDVRAHVEFEFVFLRIQQLANLLRIADGVRTARNGTGNRTGLDPLAIGAHEHLR